jgi:hypothetical protein
MRKIVRLTGRTCCHGSLDDIGNVDSALDGSRSLGRNAVVSSGRNGDGVNLDSCDGALNGDSSGHNGRSSQNSGGSGGGDTKKLLEIEFWKEDEEQITFDRQDMS